MRKFIFGEDGVFIGRLEKFGYYYTNSRYALLYDICDEFENYKSDHIWIDAPINFNAESGNIIKFYGRVSIYEKRLNGKTIMDYRLVDIEILEVIESSNLYYSSKENVLLSELSDIVSYDFTSKIKEKFYSVKNDRDFIRYLNNLERVKSLCLKGFNNEEEILQLIMSKYEWYA